MDNYGRGAVHIAAHKGTRNHLRQCFILYNWFFVKLTGNKNCKITQNSKQGTIKFLELLAQKGADFSSADGEGQTPLHLATNARNHDGACVKYLIKKINRT